MVDGNINGSIKRSSKIFPFRVHRSTRKLKKIKNKKKQVGEPLKIPPGYLREQKWWSHCTWKWEKVEKLSGMKYHTPEVKI